mmetsp:Transcript_123623/g.308922  ORF Transcript_123623/g.308922 Transcript_123623/m.308922 type:complete len:80 (+) Transcript_123623:1328-1567(+)
MPRICSGSQLGQSSAATICAAGPYESFKFFGYNRRGAALPLFASQDLFFACTVSRDGLVLQLFCSKFFPKVGRSVVSLA